MIEEITIKFGMELKPTKASWKSQLYNLPLWLFRDNLQTDSKLKCEFGNIGKTYSHRILEAVKQLHHIHLYPEKLAHNNKTSLSLRQVEHKAHMTKK